MGTRSVGFLCSDDMRGLFGFFIVMFTCLLMAGCSGETNKAADDAQKGEEEVSKVEDELDVSRFAEAEDTIDWMNAGPGKYPGGQYDEEAIKAEIAAWPEGLSAEEYFHRLLALTAEDYRKYQDYLDETEVVYEDITAKPGEDVNVDMPQAPSLHVQLLVDASGSMAGEVEGEVKLDVAKKELSDFAGSLPESAHVSLRIYGQDGATKLVDEDSSCGLTAEIYPLGAYEEEAFQKALNSFVAAGYTPLALAISEAADDLKKANHEHTKNVIYVVSDGKETCGGDPVAEVEKLKAEGIDAIVNIIGFDIDESERAALEAIAEAGDGEYFRADTARQFREMFRKEKSALIQQWREWQSENVNAAFDRQREYLDETSELRSEALDISGTERTRQLDLTRYMEEIMEDVPAIAIRNQIRSRSLSIRNHVRSEYLRIRNEARSEGLNLRNDVRSEGLEKRQEIRAQ